ncbi:hypothetical protein GCM10022215_18190 [Nocardioides fonticola]|uniref:MmcQ/YjbR family DNA-binding protein n=1 Tax=Nocardioides fonticola TaxID=450363 RepID=A0ABP7XIN7_9ACTN
MSELVPADQIERIVGARRHPHQHLARAVTAERTVYLLHSERCRDTTPDLRTCPYSVALDAGIDPDDWRDHEDGPVVVAIIRDRLFPVIPQWLTDYALYALPGPAAEWVTAALLRAAQAGRP